MNISKNLLISEVTKSATAKRRGISNRPTTQHLRNLTLLADNIYEKLISHFRVNIPISSGYRSKQLNDAIGGSDGSQHMTGQAIDIDMDGSSSKITNADIYNYIKNKLEFDQLIWEFGTNKNPDWVHVSFNQGKNRKQKLKAVRVKGKTSYINMP